MEYDLIIIGAGISGLVLAHQAQARGLRFLVLESAPKPGGVIRSQNFEGAVRELGPDTLVARPPVSEWLSHLKLDDQILEPARAIPYIARGKGLYPLPDGFRQLAPSRLLPLALTPLLSWKGKLRVLADLFLPASRTPEPTLAEFVSYRLGEEVLQYLVQPLVGGIFASDPKQLSMAATLPHFLALERRYGSLFRGFLASPAAPPKMLGLRGGLQQMVEAASQPVSTQLCCQSPVKAIQRIHEGFRVILESHALTTHQVSLATPAVVSQQLLSGLGPELAARVPDWNSSSRSVAILHLSYPAGSLPLPPTSGVLLPNCEGGPFSAISFSDQKWPQRTCRQNQPIRLHLGGAGREEWLDLDDSQLIQTCLKYLGQLLGQAYTLPQQRELFRYPQRIPEYRRGHQERIERLEASLPEGLSLAGNWLTGPGIAHCIARAQAVANTWHASRKELLCRPL